MGYEELSGYAEDLERILRLKTFPIGVKMLKEDSQIPSEAYRPFRRTGDVWPSVRPLPFPAVTE